MSKTLIKMIGLAAMVLSIFALLFGVHLPGVLGTGGIAWSMLVAVGVVALLAGFVLYVAIRKDE